jgi:hypothetical protein
VTAKVFSAVDIPQHHRKRLPLGQEEGCVVVKFFILRTWCQVRGGLEYLCGGINCPSFLETGWQLNRETALLRTSGSPGRAPSGSSRNPITDVSSAFGYPKLLAKDLSSSVLSSSLVSPSQRRIELLFLF